MVTAGEGAMGHFSELPVATVREAFDSSSGAVYFGSYCSSILE
ncbi:hypothetical protein [Halalkalibacter krulwichiae]|nr:hypothetical protein [Halalkalibacter krulwichiae]